MRCIYVKSKIILVGTLVMSLILSACTAIGKNEQKYISDFENVTNTYRLTKEDERAEFNAENIQCKIDLNEVNDQILHITKAGDYILSGTYYGQIYVTIDDDEMVHLFLDNANIFSKCGPTIYVETAGKIVITALKETENVLTDSVNYNAYEEQKSCIYSNADVSFNGNGNLNIFGYYNDAVKSKGYIKIADTDIQIRSKDIGIRANDGILISNSTLDIQSEGTGLYTKNANKEARGHIEILSGNISIISGKNAIYSAADVRIFGGSVAVNSVDEKIKAGGIAYIKEGCLQ